MYAVKEINAVKRLVTAGGKEMANSVSTNPVVIDTDSADVDIALGHTGVSKTTMFIDRVSFEGGTAADTFVLKDAAGNQVTNLTIGTGLTDSFRDLDGWPAHGLQALAADMTITSGDVKIYLR